MANWTIHTLDSNGKPRREFWRITESVHIKGGVLLNLTRKGKVRTIRVR